MWWETHEQVGWTLAQRRSTVRMIGDESPVEGARHVPDSATCRQHRARSSAAKTAQHTPHTQIVGKLACSATPQSAAECGHWACEEVLCV